MGYRWNFLEAKSRLNGSQGRGSSRIFAPVTVATFPLPVALEW